MRKSQITALLLLAALSIGVAVSLWSKAFPTAVIDFRVRRGEATERLSLFMESLGHPVAGYHAATSFGEDSTPKTYIELQYGIQPLEQMTKAGLNIWYWTVRWFKPGQHEEFNASLDPEGRIVGFTHTIEEERELPSLDKPAARLVAEAFLRKFATQHPLEKLRFVSDATDQKPHRTDYTFTWERDDFRLGEARYQIVASVQGNEAGNYFEYLKVPDAWSRDFARKREVNNLLLTIAKFSSVGILIGFAVLLILAIKNHRVRWKDPLPWGWFALFAVVGILSAANSIPELLASYPTTENWQTFLEGVMNFFANKAVQCKYNQALSLGWHIKHEVARQIIRAM